MAWWQRRRRRHPAAVRLARLLHALRRAELVVKRARVQCNWVLGGGRGTPTGGLHRLLQNHPALLQNNVAVVQGMPNRHLGRRATSLWCCMGLATQACCWAHALPGAIHLPVGVRPTCAFNIWHPQPPRLLAPNLTAAAGPFLARRCAPRRNHRYQASGLNGACRRAGSAPLRPPPRATALLPLLPLARASPQPCACCPPLHRPTSTCSPGG